jgi:hypothetical protein
MAARKNLTQLPKTREKIRTSMLINRLVNHALGKCDMTPSQVSAASKLLRKTLPDLKPIKVEYEAAPSYVDAIRASYRYDQQNIKDAKKAGGKTRLVRQRKRSTGGLGR